METMAHSVRLFPRLKMVRVPEPKPNPPQRVKAPTGQFAVAIGDEAIAPAKSIIG